MKTIKPIFWFVVVSVGVVFLLVGVATLLQRQGVIHLVREVRIGDLISAISFTVAAVGLFLNWWQLRLAAIRKRAEFIVSVFNQFITDTESSQAFYDVEYNRLEYNQSFHGSPEERRLDRLLYYFEKIAALYKLKTISLQDLELVRYEFIRVYRNKAVKSYFETLDKLPALVGVAGGGFQQYREVAAMLDARGGQHS
jgi:hypothetical protein